VQLKVRGGCVDLDEHEGIPREKLAQLSYISDGPGKPFPDRLWHMDISQSRCAPHVSSMYMVIAPPMGGDTEFASTGAGFDRCPADFQEQLLGLDVQNDVGNLFSGTLEVSPDGIHRIDDIDESIRIAKEKIGAK